VLIVLYTFHVTRFALHLYIGSDLFHVCRANERNGTCGGKAKGHTSITTERRAPCFVCGSRNHWTLDWRRTVDQIFNT
jgi:hypothetical protein